MVLLLLELYRQHESLFTKVKQRKTVWMKVADGMQRNTNDVGGMREKFRNLKGTDNNKATGRGRKKWPYFDVFQELLGDKPGTNHTSVEVGATDTPTVPHAEQPTDDESVESPPSALGPSKLNRKRKPPQWFTDFAAEVRDSELRKLQVLEDIRTENKLQAAMRLEVMKDLNKNIKTLIDKL